MASSGEAQNVKAVHWTQGRHLRGRISGFLGMDRYPGAVVGGVNP